MKIRHGGKKISAFSSDKNTLGVLHAPVAMVFIGCRSLASLRIGERSLLSLLPLLVAILLLSACGFQLRGVTELPPTLKTVYLAAETAPADFRDELRAGLRSAGARLVEEPLEKGAVLKILQVSDDRRVLSVNSITGKVQEYELFYSVRFSLTDGSGTELIRPQKVSLTRDFRFNETEVLGKSQEEAQLKREMRREVVQQLLRRTIAQMKST